MKELEQCGSRAIVKRVPSVLEANGDFVETKLWATCLSSEEMRPSRDTRPFIPEWRNALQWNSSHSDE